jgi:C-terminal peptidase prc
MAYVEIRKEGRLVARRAVDEQQAQKGCNIRLGSAGKVQLTLGQSKVVGKYQITLFEGDLPDDGERVLEGLPEEAGALATQTEETPLDQGQQAKGDQRRHHYPVIEGYEIVGRIGQGGMGTVWKARELSTKRDVAIKFLAGQRFVGDKSKARFEREVALAAKLTHPNIARVYASGLHRGVYYYVMELVDGLHLDQYVKEHKLDMRQILELMYRVADAVRHAHSLGIIHRDLKPSNILVGKDGQPHIVDFGLAKTTAKEDYDLTISVEGEVTGTPAYMAPEQAAGRHEQISERTDVYSLGVILYHLLTGHLPHPMKGGRYDVLKRIVEDEIRDPRQFNEAIDQELEALILTALAKEPEMRYPSAAVLAQDIDNYLKGEPLYARSLSTVYRFKKRMGKHIRPMVMATLIIAVVVATIVVAYFLVSSERKKRLEAERLAGLQTTEAAAETGQVLPQNDTPLAAPAVVQPVQANAQTWKPKREPAPAAIQVEGKPFFVICARSAVPGEFAEYRQAGFNTICTHSPDNPALDEAYRQGLHVIHNFPDYLYSKQERHYPPLYWQKVEQQIAQWKDHPALMAWYEPTDVSYLLIDPSEAKRVYDLTAAGNPNVRHLMIFMPTRNWPHVKDYLAYADVLISDSLNDRNVADVAQQIDRGVDIMSGRPVWFTQMILLLDGMPTADECRSKIYLAVNHGATGVLIDGFQQRLWPEWKLDFESISLGDPSLVDMRKRMITLAGELEQLAPAILAGPLDRHERVSSSLPAIDVKTYVSPDNKTLYVIAVNTSEQRVRPTFQLPESTSPVVSVLSEQRALEHTGQFADSFEPHQSHVYILQVTPHPASTPAVFQTVTQSTPTWQPKRGLPPVAVQVEGKPFFVICARSAVPGEFAEYKQAGFNTVETQNADVPALDEAQRCGLTAISHLAWYKLHAEWGFLKQNTFTEADWKAFEAQVRQQSNHPALFAWALPTDVVLCKYAVEDVQRAYALVKKYSPDKPAVPLYTIANVVKQVATPYLNYSDIIYTENADRDLKVFGRKLDRAVERANGRPAWHVIHAHRGKYGDSEPVTVRSQCYMAVNHGITGISIDGFRERLWPEWRETDVRGMGDPANKDLRDAALQIAGELNLLTPSILAGEVLDEVFVGNGNDQIEFKAYAPDNTRLYVIAINTSDVQVQATFKISGENGTLSCLNESREIRYSHGQFEDTFGSRQTHVYDLQVTSRAAPVAGDQARIPDVKPALQDSREDVSRLPEGLVLYFDCDKPPENGRITDLSGKGNHGIVEGAQWTSEGRIGGAFHFDISRKTDRIRVPDSDSLDCQEITMAAWIKSNSTDAYWNRIIDKDWRTGYCFCLGGDNEKGSWRGKVGLEWGTTHAIYSPYAVANGGWHHVAVSHGGGRITCYVNGFQVRQKRDNGVIPVNNLDIAIGNVVPGHENSESAAFDGLIDEVMIFNRALTAREVLDLFMTASTMSAAPAVAKPSESQVGSNSTPATLSAEELKRREEGWKGSFVGIGVELKSKPEGALLAKVFAGGPAEKAGLQADQLILAVDGRSTQSMSLEQVVDLIRGPEGASVRLDLQLPTGQRRTVDVVRGEIVTSGVDVSVLDQRVGLVRITAFNDRTGNAVHDALKGFSDQGLSSIILDLRSNQGGLVNSAADVASLFLPPRRTLWFYRPVDKASQPARSKGQAVTNIPLVVLIDKETKGPSELLTAALKRNRRATLVGRTTSGGAEAKQLMKQPDGSAVLIKVGTFEIEPGQPISGKGVKPDISVPMSASPDEIVQKAIQILSEGKK